MRVTHSRCEQKLIKKCIANSNPKLHPIVNPLNFLLHNKCILESKHPERIQTRKLGNLGSNHLLGGIVLLLENTRMLLVAELEERDKIVAERVLRTGVRDGLQTLRVRLGAADIVASDLGGLGVVANCGAEEGEVGVIGGLEVDGREGGLTGDEGGDGERHIGGCGGGWFLGGL
jgi:hypothetical protein